MNEKEFTETAKRYLKKQGYEIASLMSVYDETRAEVYGGDLTNRDYVVKRVKQRPPTPDTVLLFVKDNSLEKHSAGAYPDIVAVRDGKPYMFEVKTTLDDRCIGQCLRYLTAYPVFGEITIIVPKGFAGGWLKVFSKFKLPIKVIQLAVPGVTKPNLLPRPRQPPRLLDFPEMPKTVKGLRQLWKERLTKRP